MARWLAANGAEHLVLTSRRGPDAPGAGELAAELTALGARVTVEACDVTDREQLTALVRRLRSDGATPVRAVLHAAGVAHAAPLAGLDHDELRAVLAAKETGADVLDELFAAEHLDAFVLFSSIAGVWGSGNQAAYAAANAHLDALARRRRARGLTATSVSWGAWADGGMVSDGVADHLRRRGLAAMPKDLAVAALRRAVEDDDTCVTVADVDWGRFVEGFTARRPSPLLGELPEVRDALARAAAEADAADRPDAEQPADALRARLADLSAPERETLVLGLVREQTSTALGHDSPGAVKQNQPFKDLGINSLTALELRNRLGAVTGLRLPGALVFDHPTPLAVARYVLAKLMPGLATAPGGSDSAAGSGHGDEAAVRAALASVPLSRLREAGLLDALLRLADGSGGSGGNGANEVDGGADGSEIDDMDAESLIELALGGGTNL
ncbi:beta-ketoacyl reductase [Kitasatospora aureofaciens]|uniref:beta-ketoacyl reductase n=1 Tax=Kitasatospora aureofaciens TaxID=1894 RepID=UPI00068FD511|nr:beta-ketoacyl reductase [Kitasatospora aureofaciens]